MRIVLSRPFFFLHIPKTAGTTLTELFWRCFRSNDVVRLHDGGSSADVENAVEKYLCISGHIPFSSLESSLDRVSSFTLLRDPISRVASLYNFWRRFDEALYKGKPAQVNVIHAKRLTLAELTECRHPLIKNEVANGMCKMLLSGGASGCCPATDAELFAAAKRNLDRMNFGVVEELDKSLELLQGAAGLEVHDRVMLNTSSNEVAIRLTEPDIKAIMNVNLADIMLFNYARHAVVQRHRDSVIEKQFFAGGPLSPLLEASGIFSWFAEAPLYGYNWHERETWSDGTVYRFTSGASSSSIYFRNPLIGVRMQIRIYVLFFAKDQYCEPFDALQIELGGARIPRRAINCEQGGAVVCVDLDASANNSSILKLGISSDYGYVPCHAGEDSQDIRSLFAAVWKIEIARS